MNPKLILALALVVLALGCVESTTHFFEVEQEMSGFNLSTLDENPITLRDSPLNHDEILATKLKRINEYKEVQKPTLVTGYNHSEKGFWYPLRGTWLKPNNFIVNNTIWIGNRLYILEGCENVTVRYSTLSANLSIQNSTNIVVAYANITRNINITNLNNFRLLGSNDALYYINETPVSETVVNDTIVFAPLVEPKFEWLEEGIDVIYPEHTSKVLYRGNWTAQNITYGSNWTSIDDNIRAILIDYHFAGKQWKYITIDGATCHEIPCEVEGAYCLECEEINERD